MPAMPAKDIEVGTRLPFVVLLELFLSWETQFFDQCFCYGRLFQLIGKQCFYLVGKAEGVCTLEICFFFERSSKGRHSLDENYCKREKNCQRQKFKWQTVKNDD